MSTELWAACNADGRVAFCIPWPAALGGPFLPITWYAIIILMCIVLGGGVAMRHIRRSGEDPLAVLAALRFVVPAAVIGARLVFVLLDALGGDSSRWLAHPLDVLDIRQGGLNFFGVILASALVILVYARHLRFDLWLGLDAGALGVWVAQGLGRYVNLINHELYGPPTGSSWFGIVIPAAQRIPMYRDMTLYPPDTRFHPTMIYESIWLLVTFSVALWLISRIGDRLRRGQIVGIYLMVAGVGRFIVEAWRPDQPRIPGTDVSFSRALALVEVLIGLAFVLVRMGMIRLPLAAAGEEVDAQQPSS